MARGQGGGGASNVVIGGIITVFVMCILLGLIAIFSTQMAASTTDTTAKAIFGNLSSQVSTFVTSWVPLIFLGIGILAAVIFIAMAIMYLRGTAGGMGGA